jgi:hypothetical protein
MTNLWIDTGGCGGGGEGRVRRRKGRVGGCDRQM